MEVSLPDSIRSANEFRAAPVGERAADETLGRTAFLELMITQIQNQDPLEPAKNEAFIAQLAQFSSVEGIQNLNESMDDLVLSMRSDMAIDAAALVGRNVLVPSSQTALNTRGGIAGTIGLDEPVTDLNLEIMNSSGQVVYSESLGARGRGEIRFEWDGTDASGAQVSQDFYRVTAYSNSEGARVEQEIHLPDQIVSVSIADSGLTVNLAGGDSVAANQIREIQ